MTKLLSSLILAAFALGAQAASHTGGAPMKADKPASAASGAKMSKDSMSKDGMSKDSMSKDTMKKDTMKKDDAMKKDEMKK